MLSRLQYWNRIIKAYLTDRSSQLTFWHNTPRVNPKINIEELGQYYMLFHEKAEYSAFIDSTGIPLLNYHGKIKKQYNPIAISQWGLGNYNKWKDSNNQDYYIKFINSANWLTRNLVENDFGIFVWMHHFDFEYRDTLKAPWYSGLAQGQGISVLVRAFKETNDYKYKDAMDKVMQSFEFDVKDGGINYRDSNGFNWIEEYIVDPPTHILNGFIWGLWGIYDYAIFFDDKKYRFKFDDYVETISKNLNLFDLGFWSKYEQSGTIIPMIASPFYHQLHISQLKIMYVLTNDDVFDQFSNKWEKYLENNFYKIFSKIIKIIFKVFYY